MKPGYDAELKVDTKIDVSGFNKGAKKMASTINKQWKDMSWGEKQKVLEKLVEIYGNMWDTMGINEQKAAIDAVINSVEKMEPAIDKATDATTKMSTQTKGLGKIFAALFPGSYRYRRAAVGFQEVTAEMGKTVTLMSVIKTAMIGISVIGGVLAVIFALIVKKVWDWAQKMTDTLHSSLSATSAFRDKVVELKTAFDNVKGAVMGLGATLLQALMPIIMKVINWLIKAINFITMVIASLTGQKKVLQYVAGSMTDTADSAERVEDAAKGALAAFDEINVLDLTEPEEGLGGIGGGLGGGAALTEVDVPVDFAKKAWEDFMVWFQVNVIDVFVAWWKEQPLAVKILIGVLVALAAAYILVSIGAAAWKAVKLIGVIILLIPKLIILTAKLILNAIAWIANTAAKAANIIETIIIAALLAGSFLWNLLLSAIRIAGETIAWLFNTIAKIANTVAQIAMNIAVGIWNVIGVIATGVTWAFGAAMAFLTSPIGLVILAIAAIIGIGYLLIKHWDKVKEIGGKVWDFIAKAWKTGINSIIGFLNSMIAGVVKGINLLISSLNLIPNVKLPGILGGGTIGWNIAPLVAPEIPTLATGAVIPPNSAFAAILGDQKSGTNIEAPESLIRQIIQEEMGTQEHTFKFTGTMGALVRAMKPEIDKENTRIGTSLVKGSI